jgi:hypothetical protein
VGAAGEQVLGHGCELGPGPDYAPAER